MDDRDPRGSRLNRKFGDRQPKLLDCPLWQIANRFAPVSNLREAAEKLNPLLVGDVPVRQGSSPNPSRVISAP